MMKRSRRPAVFLDRDGTLIVERNYLADPAGIEIVPGAIDALAELQKAGFLLVIVTNQSGIARGLYSEDDFRAVQNALEATLSEKGVCIDATYHCPHHPEFSGPCECRKPGPGMYRSAEHDLGADLAASFYVGDRVKDVEPAAAFGGTGILVLTGYGVSERNAVPPGTRIVADVAAAAAEILRSALEGS